MIRRRRITIVALALGMAVANGGAVAADVPKSDEAAIVRCTELLAADPTNEAARRELARMIDREQPVSTELGRRIRAALHENVRSPTTMLGFPGEPGMPLMVSGVVVDGAARPIEGAVLYVFHADSSGAYSRQGEMDEPNARLFGFMRTGSDGRFRFTTTRPGGYRKPYDGRLIPAHVHFEIMAANKATRRFQMVFRDDPRLDAYWLAWAQRQGNPVVDVTRVGDAQRCSLEIELR